MMDLPRASQLISMASTEEEARAIVNEFADGLQAQGLDQEQQFSQLRQLWQRSSDRRDFALDDRTDPSGLFRQTTTAAMEEMKLRIEGTVSPAPQTQTQMSPGQVYSTILGAQGLGAAHVRVKMKGKDFYWTGYATAGSVVSAERLHEATFHAEILEPENLKGEYRFEFGHVEDVQVVSP